MASFKYGTSRVKDVDPSCTFDEINIMPVLIFSVTITQFIISGFVFFECDFVFRGDILGSFYS